MSAKIYSHVVLPVDAGPYTHKVLRLCSDYYINILCTAFKIKTSYESNS